MTFIDFDRVDYTMLAVALDRLRRDLRREGLRLTPTLAALEATARDRARQQETDHGLPDVDIDDVLMGPALRCDYEEAERLLRLDRRSIQRRVADGRLHALKDGGRTYFERAELERYAKAEGA